MTQSITPAPERVPQPQLVGCHRLRVAADDPERPSVRAGRVHRCVDCLQLDTLSAFKVGRGGCPGRPGSLNYLKLSADLPRPARDAFSHGARRARLVEYFRVHAAQIGMVLADWQDVPDDDSWAACFTHNHRWYRLMVDTDAMTLKAVPEPDERAILYIDVDGPLNPYSNKPERRPEGYETYRFKPASWVDRRPDGRIRPAQYSKGLRVWLNPAHGEQLLNLASLYELVWCTSWREDANRFIGPTIGLPPLPVLPWEESKTLAIIDHSGQRPAVWIDDECTDTDRALFAQARPTARTLAVTISPRTGLTDRDLSSLAAWASDLPRPAAYESENA